MSAVTDCMESVPISRSLNAEKCLFSAVNSDETDFVGCWTKFSSLPVLSLFLGTVGLWSEKHQPVKKRETI